MMFFTLKVTTRHALCGRALPGRTHCMGCSSTPSWSWGVGPRGKREPWEVRNTGGVCMGALCTPYNWEWMDALLFLKDQLTCDMENSVFSDGFRGVVDGIGRRTDDTEVCASVLSRNSEWLPAWPVHLWRHPRINADLRCGITPRMAFNLVINGDVVITWSKLYVFHQIYEQARPQI